MTLALAALVLTHDTSSDTLKLAGWAVIGAAVGVILFIRGFQMLRFKRLIMNTPGSRIRSASMGLVEVNGIAKGPSTMPAGITQQACYYYRAIAWQLRQSGRNRQWKQVASESLYVPFFVEDSTGRLLVDPQGADLDLQRNFKDQFDTSFFSSNRHMLPENVAQFLLRNGVSFTESIRVEEYCVKPDSPLFVFGTLRQNSNRASWTPGPHVADGTSLDGRLSLLGAGGTPFEWLRRTFPTTGVSSSHTSPGNWMPDVSRVASARTPSPASVWSEVSMDEGVVRRQAAQSDSRRATPVAVADPEPTSDSAASEAAPSAGYDLYPSVLIGKGERRDPFVISWRSQREVVQSLAWKSVLCIWGGPALSLISLYCLAQCLGWL
jgi:hypothetical protein